MEAINGFLDYRDGDAFGLTFFGNNVLLVPLTNDTAPSAARFMTPSAGRCRPGSGDSIGKALNARRDGPPAGRRGTG